VLFPLLIWLTLCLSKAIAINYFVATSYGNDNNSGISLLTPYKTIGKAASVMSAGDKCYIRQGRYHEIISINNLDGVSASPIVFTNYNNERVVIDGTIPITSVWAQIGSTNIWRTKLTSDIWQLFLDWEEQVMARWPNAKFNDNTIWDNDNHWAKGTIDNDENAYSNGTLIDDPYTNSSATIINLSAAGFDLDESGKQAIVILNVGSFRTWSRFITSHSGNTITYDTVPNWKTKHHYYYLEGKLKFLDQEGEWWFDTLNDSLYYYPENGANPNRLNLRGKVQSYAFNISGSKYIQIKNIEFFGTTVNFENGDNCLVYGCNFMYPSCSKRMLRIVDTEPEMTKFSSGSTGSTIRNCAFRNTDGTALEMWGGTDTVDNCYFNNIDYSVADNSSIMLTIRMNGDDNVFRKNTVHKTGASATVKVGNSGLLEYNNLYDTGHLQSDGSMIQFTEDEQDGAICRYNWLHDTEKYGARFDHSGTADGINGTMHHNVAWNCKSGGIMIKGNSHMVYNNTVLNSGSKNDIIVLKINDGDHSSTIVRNNAADKIANHRTNNIAINFGTYSNNWNGYDESETLSSILEDTSNNNFSPSLGSALIDAGISVVGITDQYTNNGSGPDIGAYEDGNINWIGGHDWNVSSTFGSSWIPIHRATISGNSGFRMFSSPVSGYIVDDLLDELWTQGMSGGDATEGASNIWILDLEGQSWSSVSNISSQSLTAGQGFLVYVFDDIDFDGDSDLPVDLYVSGDHNMGDISIIDIPENHYYLAGNPYPKTISWDDISKTNLSSVVSIWDDATSSWKTYNGSSGDLINGLIAPFQGFLVQASGGIGSFTIQSADIATTPGIFLGKKTETDSTGYTIITASSDGFTTSSAYFSYEAGAEINLDNGDAKKLLPLDVSPRIAAMSIVENTPLKINNLPFVIDTTADVQLDILVLYPDSIGNFLTLSEEVTLTINMEGLPNNIILNLIDNRSGLEYDLHALQSITFITENRGSFSATSSGAFGTYPQLGNPRFTLKINNTTMRNQYMHEIPNHYSLHPIYPNPFNPVAVIKYDIPIFSEVKITVYNLRGRLVATVVNKKLKPGRYSYSWVPDNLASGVYILKLKTNKKEFRQKITFIK